MKMTIKQGIFISYSLKINSKLSLVCRVLLWTGDSHSIFREDLRIGEIPKTFHAKIPRKKFLRGKDKEESDGKS